MSKTFKEKTPLDVEGSCFLFKYETGGNWQVQLGVPSEFAKKSASGKVVNERRKSCKTKNLEKAKSFAMKLYNDQINRIDNNKSVYGIGFSKLVSRFLKHIKASESASKLLDYTRVCENYFIPFFGDKDITKINDADIKAYWNWRYEQRLGQMEEHQGAYERRVLGLQAKFERKQKERKRKEGRSYIPEKFEPPIYKPKFKSSAFPASTISSENAPLRRIFKFAVGLDYLHDKDIPYIGMPDDDAMITIVPVERDIVKKATFSMKEIERIKQYLIKRFEKRREAIHGQLRKLGHPAFNDPFGVRNPKANSAVRNNEKAFSAYRLMVALNLIIHTGMRPSTLTRLKIKHVLEADDLNFEGMFEEVDSSQAGNAEKGGKWRVTHQELATILAMSKLYEGKNEVKYVFEGATRKGKKGKLRWGYIVPDQEVSSLFRGYLFLLGTDDKDALIFDVKPASLNQAFKRMMREKDSDLGSEFEFDRHENPRSLYSLRHFYITRKIAQGLDLSMIAKNALTSTSVIEQYYDHYCTTDEYNLISGWQNNIVED